MISVTNLSYKFDGGTELVFPDFTLRPEEHTLLIGESGSGKTTLLHLLGGLLKSQAGSISMLGIELSSLNARALDHFRSKNIGFIFQRNHLIQALSVKENILLQQFLSGKRRDDIKELLSSLGISTKADASVTELSVGQQQRVAIARAVSHHPSIILADEPTSALDDKNCGLVADLLLTVAAKNKATLLVATHDQRLKAFIRREVKLSEQV